MFTGSVQTHPDHTVCPGSSDPSHIVSYYIKGVTTSWTYSNSEIGHME